MLLQHLQMNCKDVGIVRKLIVDYWDFCDVMTSCDSQAANPRLIASIVVVIVAMYGEHWLAGYMYQGF